MDSPNLSALNLDPRIVARAPFDLRSGNSAVIVAAYVGSQSHGTYIPSNDGGIDDVDIRGSIMPPVARLLGLTPWDHWVEMFDELDITFFRYLN